MQPHILLVDNYDSYTWNIVDLVEKAGGVRPLVRAHDELDLSADYLAGLTQVILGPGPGHPTHERDVGAGYDLLRAVSCPVLGICLGHQMLAQHLGGVVEPSATPAHGEISRIRHQGGGIFAGLPPEFKVVRYHSLTVVDPAEFEVVARSDADQQIMAMSHPVRPWHGVQFHPESICSEYGVELLRNFLALGRCP